MVFAGDEFGLTGSNGEGSRTPMPWGSPVVGYYRDLIAMRRRYRALREGGLRWAYTDDDTIAYLRETADERLLVLARRAPGKPVDLPVAGAENVYGGMSTVDGDGPTFQVWCLP